jgi:hypothetical protein
MTTEGRCFHGDLEEGQFILLPVNQHERTLPVEDILWMFGDRTKTLRLIGSRVTTSGSVKGAPLRMKTSRGDRMITNPEDIAFLCKWPSSSYLPSHLLLLETQDRIVTLGMVDPARTEVLDVVVVPSSWKGDVKLSNPRCPSVISSGAPFTLSLDVEGDDATYRNLTKKALGNEAAERPILRLTFGLSPKLARSGQLVPVSATLYVHLYEYAEKGALPNDVVRKRSVPVEVTMGDPPSDRPSLFGSRYGVYEGEGTVYVCMTAGDEDEEYANRKVRVARTVSNVVRVDVKFAAAH